MSTITREQLRERARQKIKSLEFAVTQTAFADSRPELEEELELARIALASLEAEAVAEVCEGFTLRYIGHGPAPKSGVRIGDRLYTAPPAPVSVPDFGALTKCIVQRLVDYGAADDDAIARAEEFVYNAYRAAMLQSFGNSEQLNSPVIPDGLRLALSNAGIAAPESDEMMAATCEKHIQALVTWVKERKPFRSAVIPDGWVACSERMPEAGDDMIVFTDDIVMSGVSYSKKKGFYLQALGYDDDEPVDNVTHWMPLPAAPQQEVK
ncbi:DUF551 domain-containing protein [Enterobacter hormaechei]|uniref:DUF551 domain-containing protein n=1 Tax=Enterobacter hormaechei TaxID=158836 RepID=UPI002AA5E1EE|nr:DUF551 domain-containing protein [Enterobacter hormaechei]MDY7153677.1 DUF551 domain-containing protein [Enterobacter hormaechei]